MRIGVNCFLLQENMGGVRQYFHRLFGELLLHDKKDRYILFYFKHNTKELEQIGSDRWKEEAILLEDQREVVNHLDKIDLYFCPFGSLWPRPVPIPSVVTLVDIQEKYYPQFFTKQDLWNREYHYDGSTKAADQVITISEFSKSSIAYHHRISKDKIHVVYLAADDYFDEPFEKDEIKLGLPERYIFYPANRWLHKNHDNLLRALAIIKRENHLAIDCVLTGFDYDNGYPLYKKIAEYGLDGQIKILGYVNKHELKYIYKKAQMLCFPSLFEGFGLPLLEAMAVGSPVVCSDQTSIPEVVGNAALFFNPFNPNDIADKIYKVWTNKELQQRLRENGKAQAQNFSVAQLFKRHLEVFELAFQSYRKRRYIYYKYIYEPIHTFRMYWKKKALN